MRWDELFQDLAEQAGAERVLELLGEAAELARAERAGRGFREALALRVGSLVRFKVSGGGVVQGTLLRPGPESAGVEGAQRRWLVPWDAVQRVEFQGARGESSPLGDAGDAQSGPGLRTQLRQWGRDRVPVRLWLKDGTFGELAQIREVGRDHVLIAEGGSVVLVPLHALAAIEATRPGHSET